METKISQDLSSPKAGLFAGISVFSGLGAIAAKPCCILPFLLASSGIGSAWLSRELVMFRPYLLVGALLSLVIGWTLLIRRNRAACQKNAPWTITRTGMLTLTMLGLATLFVGLAAVWDFLQPVFVYLKQST